MDSAVYQIGMLAGVEWLQSRLQMGDLADIREMIELRSIGRDKLAYRLAGDFGLSATAGGMKWDQYKRQAYAAGWIAGFNAAAIEELQSGEMRWIFARILIPDLVVT